MRISDWSSDVCSSDLPVAVTAVVDDALEQKGATNISAVAQSVPSLTFNTTAGNSGASNAAVVFIRGIGQDDFFPTIDPGVGIYRDGVYVSRTLGGVLDTVDIEQENGRAPCRVSGCQYV